MEILTVPPPRIEFIWCPATPDSDDPDTEGRDADLGRIAEWEAKYGDRRRLNPFPAPEQWRPIHPTDPRYSHLEKTVRSVRGRGKWRWEETWELPFPELLHAWNTWLVCCRVGPGAPGEGCFRYMYEFSWWGVWVEYDDETGAASHDVAALAEANR